MNASLVLLIQNVTKKDPGYKTTAENLQGFRKARLPAKNNKFFSIR